MAQKAHGANVAYCSNDESEIIEEKNVL